MPSLEPSKTMYAIDVKIDRKDFRTFAVFDVFYRLKRWIQLATFAGILAVFATVCFILHSKDNAVLLGAMLMLIGFGLPIAYVKQFFTSVKAQAKLLGLMEIRHVYTIELSPEQLTVRTTENGAEEKYALDEIFSVYRRANFIYMYVSKTKAYIIPTRQQSGTDSDGIWQLISSALTSDKVHDMKK